MPAVARVGDTGSHGGSITTGSSDTITNGQQTARLNDTYSCPIHGDNPITSASQTVIVNGRGVARIGDSTSCGAQITSGSPNVFAD